MSHDRTSMAGIDAAKTATPNLEAGQFPAALNLSLLN